MSDVADAVQDVAIRYSGGIFADDSVDIDAVAVVANPLEIELIQRDSTYTEEIRSLSEGDVRSIACKKSMEAAGVTVDDILAVVDTAPTTLEVLTRLQEEGYRYIKVP